MLTYHHHSFFQTKASGLLYLVLVVGSTRFFSFGWRLLFPFVGWRAFSLLVVPLFVGFVAVCVASAVVVFVVPFVLSVFEVAFDNIVVAAR
jgi:hypothetical protein